MLTTMKQTVWKSGSKTLIELDGKRTAYVTPHALTADELRDLAEAAAAAADALDLINETEATKVRIAE